MRWKSWGIMLASALAVGCGRGSRDKVEVDSREPAAQSDDRTSDDFFGGPGSAKRAANGSPSGASNGHNAESAGSAANAAPASAAKGGKWRGRETFDRPGVRLLASSRGAADEAAGVVAAAARRYESEYGGTPVPILLIVTDEKDEPLTDDEQTLVEVIRRGQPPELYPENGEAKPKPDENWEKQSWQAKELGLSMHVLPQCAPFGIDPQDARQTLGLPGIDGAAWIAGAPTKKACRKAAKELVDGAMKSNKISTGQRILIAPWMGMMRSAAGDELAAEREAVLVEHFIAHDNRLSSTEKRRLIEEHRAKQKATRQGRANQRREEIRKNQPR